MQAASRGAMVLLLGVPWVMPGFGEAPSAPAFAPPRPVRESPRSEPPVADTVVVARFSALTPADSLPPDWLLLAFGDDRGATLYRPDERDGRSCLAGEARAGGSGLVRPMVVDPAVRPRLRWSWWVEGPVQGGDLTRKEGDDFAARIYVNFRFEPSKAGLLDRIKHRLAGKRFGGEAPGRSLIYVWGNEAPAGTVAPNAYTEKAMVIVVRSGEEGARTWHEEERNVLEDFRGAFGEEPPEITSIAVMSDADDTGATASACYGDILLLGPGRPGPTSSPMPVSALRTRTTPG